jgi:ADP-ribosylglycohydrolase
MYGSIIGDIIGSVYEFINVKRKDIALDLPNMRFTDDTVLTVATMDALLHPEIGYAKMYKRYFRKYVMSDRGFGGLFFEWGLSDSLKPYNSFGNGSAMRVSPVAWACNTLEEVLKEAKKSAEVTHNHPEGIKGAQAIAVAIFMARNNASKLDIEKEVIKLFKYDLTRSLDEIRFDNVFDETCQGSVPEAITAFLDSNSYEDTIRSAISIGGDSDTIACMAGGIAEAFYGGINQNFIKFAKAHLDHDLLNVITEFYDTYKINYIV